MQRAILVAATMAACAACGGSAKSSDQSCAQLDSVQCTAPSCYPTWAAVQASTPHCNDASGWKETLSACDGYDLYVVSGVDYKSVYYYDKATGALVAVANQSNAGQSCAAGSAGVPSAADCPTDGPTTDRAPSLRAEETGSPRAKGPSGPGGPDDLAAVHRRAGLGAGSGCGGQRERCAGDVPKDHVVAGPAGRRQSEPRESRR